MSVRSLNLLFRNVIQRQSRSLFTTSIPARSSSRLMTTHFNSNYYALKTGSRFYSAGKQQQKLSTMISSPEIIKTAKEVEPKASKLKELTKKYGAAGILVYLAVGCVDLGVTLGVIQLVGLEKVKALEEGVLDVVYSTGEKFGMKKKEPVESPAQSVVAAEKDTPSFASVFLLAYGIHKTLLLPVRLGITAAITPAIVRKLHQLGWTRYFPRIFAASAPKKP